MNKVDSVQEQMGNLSRERNPKIEKKKMLEIKNMVTEEWRMPFVIYL